jgi:hypothetical protein
MSAEKGNVNRRDFLKIGGVATAGLLAHEALPAAVRPLPALPENPKTFAAMPTRNLGKTGYRVGIFSLGGQATVELPNREEQAAAIVERALDLGVNYIDTAASYGGTERWSQRYIGKVMARRRNQAYLASKTNDRTRDGSLKLLDESLKLLNTDYLDAWQLHHVSTMAEVEQIFGKGGAIEALQQAHEQKMVRNLGVTGHADPEVLMECLRRFPFDQILMALNGADKHHKSFLEKLLPMAVEKQLGIIGMKIPARGHLLTSWVPGAPGKTEGAHATAVKPGTLDMREALYYVLSQPVSTVIIGCDSVAQLEENVKLAREFTPLSEEQLAAISAKSEPVTQQALFFRYPAVGH